MRKVISDKSKLIFVFLFLLLISLLVDITTEKQVQSGYISRNEVGEEEKQIQLELGIEGIVKDYEYSLEVLPVSPTKEMAESCFAETIVIMEQDFLEMKDQVPVKKAYLNGAVEAEWSFQPFGFIDEEGNIRSEEMDEEEKIIQAQVELSCGNYVKIHTFSFLLRKPSISEKERIIKELETQIEQQMLEEGSGTLKLPTRIEGKKVSWTEKREYITPQILMLELATVVLLWMYVKKRRQEEEKVKRLKMEQVYPDIVSQLSLLLGAGMTTRQAWAQMAGLYKWKRTAGMVEPDMVYEAILRMSHKLAEGESERMVYQSFSEEISVACYRKLMRILVGSLEKGAQGISIRLQEESRSAFEQRLLIAKKRGEEASTKMLVPLMIMMTIVMAMVMLPALLEFQI